MDEKRSKSFRKQPTETEQMGDYGGLDQSGSSADDVKQ